MRPDIAVVNALIRGLFRIACRLDISDMGRIPRTGAAILVVNHINFLEVPLMATFLAPRKLAALSKKENLKNRAYSYFTDIWNAIPIDRGNVDTESFRRCLEWVAEGGQLALAPEGSRSRTGVLNQGKAGAAVLAQRAGVPVWPMAHWGGEKFWANVKAFKRTPVTVRVGRPFMIKPQGSMTKTVRQEIADEIMAQIAALMPEAYRGPYGNGLGTPPKHLDFPN